MQILLLSMILALCTMEISDAHVLKSETHGSSDNSTLITSEINSGDSLIYPGEVHFRNMRMLTNGGDNAEAYWSFDNRKLIFQANVDKWNTSCDQIFLYDLEATDAINNTPTMLSTGKGRTTCSYFMPGNDRIIYASTHHNNSDCPAVPEPRADHKYVWPVYADYDLFVADLKGNIVSQLTTEPGYDAEATVSPTGDKIVFTSTRTGDLELFTMDIDGSNVSQVTNQLGYDGGAFFSPDGTKLLFRASRPKTTEEVKVYKELLSEGLVQPTNMELYTCNVDGTDLQKITDLGNANWAPFFHPSGKKILFSSNHQSERGFPFNLFMINTDGTGLEQITFDEVFASFPMFSYDGKQLVFASNRNNGGTRATNLFLVDWID